MDFISSRIPYRQTGHFSGLVLDYLDRAAPLSPFYAQAPSLQGIKKSVEGRNNFPVDRELLVDALKKQYEGIQVNPEVERNIDSLLSENTFAITTAHQPNIFTGPLYFIYKIIQAIKLASHCNTALPEYCFVPVFCMGSEDADFDELGHIFLGGQKLEWETKQTGAVGRMKIDKNFLKLISLIEGQLNVEPFGKSISAMVKECYKEGSLIQDATFHFNHALFGEYGLVVLIPDTAALKKHMIPVFEDELLHQNASSVVEKTAGQLQASGYKPQVNPREINLFYLVDGKRERIIKAKNEFIISGSRFTAGEIVKELQDHPERFSPNVILRGLYQETILPGVAFIGGGGEIAYWLQLKELFDQYKVNFPVLVLRNSFLIVGKKWQELISKLGFTAEDFFLPADELIKRLVEKESKQAIKLNGNFNRAEEFYSEIRKQAATVDSTLARHVDALKTQSLHRLQELEKKMLRAEKRKYAEQQRQIQTIKSNLFPGDSLQERSVNMLYYYARWGKDFLHKLVEHSPALEQEFVIMQESWD